MKQARDHELIDAHVPAHQDHPGETTTSPNDDFWLDSRHTRLSPRSVSWQKIGRSWLRFLATSPGLMTLMCIAVSFFILAAGASMSQSAADRRAALDRLVTATEPLSFASHNLYYSLSATDTAAITAFVSADESAAKDRQNYLDSLQRAGTAALAVARLAATPEETQTIGRIQQNLIIYSGLIEAARANARLGNPVGTSYVGEANYLMSSSIVPDAQKLLQSTTEQVGREQYRLTAPQLVPLSGLAAAVFTLLLAQLWLYRKTRRRINSGFALATALMIVATSWVAGSNWVTWNSGVNGYERAAEPLKALTAARITAEQARSQEVLALVLRQSVVEGDANFEATTHAVHGAVVDFRTMARSQSFHATSSTEENPREVAERTATAAENAVRAWSFAHQAIVFDRLKGSYDDAVTVALGLDPDPTGLNASAAFQQLDESLGAMIDTTREEVQSSIYSTLDANRLVAGMVLFLSVLSILSIWIGIRPRLQEYL